MTPEERIAKFAMPVPFSGCWIWIGYVDRDGYGHIDRTTAHGYTYRHIRGPIQDGLELDHKCEVRCCVNPDHLEVVTRKENTQRSYDRGRHFQAKMTHCSRGHPFEGENLYVNPNNGKRICRTCMRECGRKFDAKRRLRVGPR